MPRCEYEIYGGRMDARQMAQIGQDESPIPQSTIHSLQIDLVIVGSCARIMCAK
jgi:hypothetical protein